MPLEAVVPGPSPGEAPKSRGPWWAQVHPATWLMWALLLPGLALVGWTSAFLEDEFLSIAHAVELGRGGLLYRDHFDFLTPLSHWFLALLLPLGLGPLATAHLALAGVAAGVVALVHAASRQLGAGPWASAMVGLAFFGSALRLWPGWSHHWMVWPWLLAALLLSQQAFRQEQDGPCRWPWWWATGAMLGLAVGTLQPDGLLVGFALTAWAVLAALLGRLGWPLAWRRGIALLLGGASTVGLVALVLCLQGVGLEAWEGAVLFPLFGYKQPGGVNDLPWLVDLLGRLQAGPRGLGWLLRSWNLLALYAVVLVGPWAWALGLAWRYRKGQAWALADQQMALWVGAALASAGVALAGRADAVHVAASSPPALVLLGATVGAWGRRFQGGPKAAWPMALFGAWVAVGLLWFVAEIRAQPQAWLSLASPDARVQQALALRWLQSRMKAGESVVALPYGGVFATYSGPSASRWLLLFPPTWGYNTAADWSAHWQQVAQRRPAFVLVAPWPPLRTASLAPWVDLMPPGYQKVGQLPPIHASWGVPLYVFARADKAAEATRSLSGR